MITQSVFYPNNRVSSKLKLHTLTIDTRVDFGREKFWR
jgi:hypothetical protein